MPKTRSKRHCFGSIFTKKECKISKVLRKKAALLPTKAGKIWAKTEQKSPRFCTAKQGKICCKKGLLSSTKVNEQGASKGACFHQLKCRKGDNGWLAFAATFFAICPSKGSVQRPAI